MPRPKLMRLLFTALLTFALAAAGCGNSSDPGYTTARLQRLDDCLRVAGFETQANQSVTPASTDKADAIQVSLASVPKPLALITMAGAKQIDVPPPGSGKSGVAQVGGVVIRPLLLLHAQYLRPVGELPQGRRILACAASTSTPMPASASNASAPLPPTDAKALRVVQVQTPPLDVPPYRYKTSGTYPQISGSGEPVAAVNDALTNAVLAYQRDYVGTLYRVYGHHYEGFGRYAGVFTIGAKATVPSIPEAISASTKVVSALIPVLSLYPGGNDGSVWMSSTVRVPSGEAVSLEDLLTNSGHALSAIADIARTQVLADNKCVRQTTAGRHPSWTYLHSYAPTAAHGVGFALAPEGLALGYPNGLLASPSCGRIQTAVAYSQVFPYLNGLGKQLVAGVRRPQQ